MYVNIWRYIKIALGNERKLGIVKNSYNVENQPINTQAHR